MFDTLTSSGCSLIVISESIAASIVLLHVAVRQNGTDLIVEAYNSQSWLPVCVYYIPDWLASQLCTQLGQRRVISSVHFFHLCCVKHIPHLCSFNFQNAQ